MGVRLKIFNFYYYSSVAIEFFSVLQQLLLKMKDILVLIISCKFPSSEEEFWA